MFLFSEISLTRRHDSGFFHPASPPFLFHEFTFVEFNICQVVFHGEFNELGFEAIRHLVIALKSQLRHSGARLVLRIVKIFYQN